MTYYDDEYFKDFEDVYSDSRRRNIQRRPSSHPTDRKIDSRQSRSRDPYSGEVTRRRDEAPDPRSSARRQYDPYGYDLRDFQPAGRNFDADPRLKPQNNVRYPNIVRRKHRMPRRARRVLIVAGMLVILIAFISVIAAIASSATGVGEVKSLKVSEVNVDSVVLSWEQAKHAEGYRVMMATGGGTYEEYRKIDDPAAESVTISQLEQATTYSFSVTALRKEKESEAVRLENVTTLPQAPEITNIISAKKGAVHLDWTANEKASGYVVEYKKDGGAYTADASVTISDPTVTRTDITDLEVNADYTVRVYAYLSLDEQLSGVPSPEASVKVAAEDTEVVPKAMDQQLSEGVDPNKPMIALTFDDGPAAEGDSSERILDVLEANNAKATFFMVGINVDANPENVRRKQALGMELGNHTWNHAHYGSEVTPDDIRMASNKIYDVTGQYPTCFRSPGGMTTTAILNECATENVSAYYWSIDTEDWNSRNADAVYHAVMDHVQDGDIILMHEIYGSTADAVERMVPELIAQGYQLVTCHDLVAAKTGADPVPGTQYVTALSQLDP